MNAQNSRNYKTVRDPVHGYIRIPREIVPLVNSRYVQRLRNISQNSRAIAAFPSLNGSRFEHALGTMHLSIEAWRSAWASARGSDSKTEAHTVQAALLGDVEQNVDEMLKDPRFPDPYLKYLRQGMGNVDQEEVRARWERRFARTMELAVGVVGLLHDVGHPPYSHVLEDRFERWSSELLPAGSEQDFQDYRTRVGAKAQYHEWAGQRILESILLDERICEDLPVHLVWEIFCARKGAGWAASIHQLIDGQIDVDRLDYICRDATRAGTDYYAVDIQRLVDNLELHHLGKDRLGRNEWKIGVGHRGVSAIESLLLQRDQSYRWMIFHPKAILADTALNRAFDYALKNTSQENRPCLDYISDWECDQNRSCKAYRVDDHHVIEWLRDLRDGAHGHDGKGEGFEIFSSCMALCDEFHNTAISSWRNYGEFLDALVDSKNALQPMVNNAIRKTPELFFGDQGLGLPKEQYEQMVSTLLSSDKIEVSEATLGRILIEDLTRIYSVDPHFDRTLENSLNEDMPTIDDVRGHWLVAHRMKFNAIKEGESFIWEGSKEVSLDRLSPIYDGLMRSNEMRPMIWAFFLPFDKNNDTAYSESVQRAFIGKIVSFDQS